MNEQLYWEDALFVAFLAMLYWKWIIYELRKRLKEDLLETEKAVMELSEAAADLPRYHQTSLRTAKCRRMLKTAQAHVESGSDWGVIHALELLNHIRIDGFFAKEALKPTL